MPQYKSNQELKYLARMQTGQHMGLLIGTVILNFIISFAAVNLVSSLVSTDTTVGYIINYILVLIVQIVASVLNVGVDLIFLKSACGMPSSIGDLFYGYKQNFVRALEIGTVITIIQSICMIPVDWASLQLIDVMDSIPLFNEFNGSSVNAVASSSMGGYIDSRELLEAYNILANAMMKYYTIMLICTVVSVILTLPFFPAYYMLLDFPDWSASMILKRSFEVMNGNKWRLLKLYLSFIPLYLLCIVTCGLALIWVIPYMDMTVTNFYLDLMAVRNKNVGY